MAKYIKKLCISMICLMGMASSLELPKEMILEYSGPWGIPAKLKFVHDNKNYSIDTTVAIPFKNMRFATKGIIQNNQLKPTEYKVYREKTAYSLAIFDYANKKITYGKLPERKESVLQNNTQDLFTLAWQMTVSKGTPLKNSYVTDGKKLYALPVIQKTKEITHAIDGKQQSSDYYQGGEGDRRLEIGLAKGLYSIPSVIVYYDKGTRYELTLRRATIKQ